MNVLRHDQGWDDGGPMVLMSDWWVRAHWGRAFEILETAEVHGQTWALMRRRDVALTVADLERPSDDPREFAALRHNLRQVQRELEGRGEELRRDYEGTRSWRLTRPWRRLTRAWPGRGSPRARP
jgi:hypothetical protein